MSETKQVGAPRGERSEDSVTERPPVEFPGDAGQPASGVAEEGQPSGPEEIRLDVIFDILKNQRRRHVLRYLREYETTTLSDLAEHVAALENGKDVQSLTSSERKRVYVGLYQCHLPRMNDAGVIDFDSDRGRIELNDTAEQLDQYLDVADDANRPWYLYQFGIALGGGALYGASALALGPGAPLTLLVVPALVAASALCAYSDYRSHLEDEDE